MAGSPWFLSPGPAGSIAVRDSVVHVEADGRVVTATVTDHDGTKREYRARVELVSGQCRYCTVPVDSGDTCTFCAAYTPPGGGPG